MGMGRRRQYCRQSCRQRAYEQRAQVKAVALPPDGADGTELRELCAALLSAAKAADGWR
jgi:hypothetical protein